jgi:hypothetical protein
MNIKGYKLLYEQDSDARARFGKLPKLNTVLFVLGLLFYIVPGILYFIWVKSKTKKILNAYKAWGEKEEYWPVDIADNFEKAINDIKAGKSAECPFCGKAYVKLMENKTNYDFDFQRSAWGGAPMYVGRFSCPDCETEFFAGYNDLRL